MTHDSQHSDDPSDPQEVTFVQGARALTARSVDIYNSTNLGELYAPLGPRVTDTRLRALKKVGLAAVVDLPTAAVLDDVPWPARPADELRDNERYGFGPGEGRRRQ